jgi:hypothetical protein
MMETRPGTAFALEVQPRIPERLARLEELALVHALQERLGAVPDRFPQRRVQAREQRARRPVPAVPQVVGELFEPCEPLGDVRPHFERKRSAGVLVHGPRV